MINIKAIKIALANAFDGFAATRCYYDAAPQSAPFPYAVISNIHGTPLEAGELLTFNLIFYGDATTEDTDLEALADTYRNAADGAIITDKQTFYGHINFNSQDDGSLDAETDLEHRQQTYSARVFFI